ncbi:RNA polymerase II-associated protein 3-like isoform X2 [Leptidea sinapis]|uniref:RNA polymerase II-associated protein 3-like isoform X2 n=1 Tax=Leptidea sinapis TaxID=189913 RepID=UPI0021C47340|nr:RNA polymerase II-associated protein 3-like isoform X2 [Leptidea sinapis]
MEKAFEIQRQARDNVKSLQTYFTDLQNWEKEMKRKEAALKGDFEQDLPPVRSKVKKEKPVVVMKKPAPRIAASDYNSWDKFDVDKACEEVDMADVGPASLDSKKSQEHKQGKLREEAQYEKERGNTFVKQEKWDEAISCYNRAIELVKNDAIYYANRGLCYLKKDSLHQAEKDCTEALKLDPTYVKALQRRATARERLGSLRAASNDLVEVLKLEPRNEGARRQLEAIKIRMSSKGSKSKSSPLSTPTKENKSIVENQNKPKIVEIEESKVKELSPLDKWKDGAGENITIIKTVKKPPHLRSKRALKHITIQEIPLGCTTPQVSVQSDSLAHGDTNNTSNTVAKVTQPTEQGDTYKLCDVIMKDLSISKMEPPMNSVQFMHEWKYMKGYPEGRSDYLSIIAPSNIPSIFANALESDTLSEILFILHEFRNKYAQIGLSKYLRAFTGVKRFTALAMFLSPSDKELVGKMLEICKTTENLSDEEYKDLRIKYEL